MFLKWCEGVGLVAVSQASIIESLEKTCSNLNTEEFIFSFLDAYGLPKSTITRLRNRDDNRNIGIGNDIGLKKKLYFRSISGDVDINEEAESLRVSDVVARNDIRFVIVTDFKNLIAFDLLAEERLEIPLNELDKNYSFFLPLAGYEKAVMFSEHPADLKASEKMGKLFDVIREGNDLTKPEDIHALNVFLTRLLFCFYAEDTGIFSEAQFNYAFKSFTLEDGSDVDQFFYDLFRVLNLEENSPERQKLPAHFQAFKYVNGGLFKVDEPIPAFGRRARRILLDCAMLNWSEINPDIFGSMFQAVIDEEQRGNLGQHYTSVPNIMKVIQPLFLDKLYENLEQSRGNEKKLQALFLRLQRIKIFDPACGSGNFLIISYKELRRFEMEVIDAINVASKQEVIYSSGIELTQFYGIEIDDFACEIARLSLWLAEHQMNTEFETKFGHKEAILPLRDGGNVVCGNSLLLGWEEVCSTHDGNQYYEVYVCGNPPFLGNVGRSKQQNEDMKKVFSEVKLYGKLDLVASWFWKGAQYIQNKSAHLALVSTNSLCQGEQVGILWPNVFAKNLTITFAYPTLPWKNQAKDNAAVHVVIVGLANKEHVKEKSIFKMMNDDSIHRMIVKNISPYLLEGTNGIMQSRRKPLCNVPAMIKGNMPYDGGHLLLTTHEKDMLLKAEPKAEKWIKRILGSREFLHGQERWCLWLVNITAKELDELPLVAERVKAVKAVRLASPDLGGQKLALRPHLFREINNPLTYILVPSVSSERRHYVPMGFLGEDVISTNLNLMIPNATLYEFGIITSEMHNDWMRTVAGRLESRYRYSATLVYNTFPWPEASNAKRKHIESLAEEVLLIREDYPDKTLAELYDPDKMPEPLLNAHKTLDRAVEALYRERPFRDASERLEYLFHRYEKLIAAEETEAAAKKTKRGK